MDRYYWQTGQLPRIQQAELAALVGQHREGVRDTTNEFIEGMILHMCYVASKFSTLANHDYDDMLSAIVSSTTAYVKKHINGKLAPDIFVLSVRAWAYKIAKRTLVENKTVRVPYDTYRRIMIKHHLDTMNLIVDSKGSNTMDARIGNEQQCIAHDSIPINMESKYDFWEIVRLSASTELEWKMIVMYSQGHSGREIARKLDLGHTFVNHSIKRILDRMRNYLKD